MTENAHKAGDLWALGCIYSECATWMEKNGAKKLDNYRWKRQADSKNRTHINDQRRPFHAKGEVRPIQLANYEASLVGQSLFEQADVNVLPSQVLESVKKKHDRLQIGSRFEITKIIVRDFIRHMLHPVLCQASMTSYYRDTWKMNKEEAERQLALAHDDTSDSSSSENNLDNDGDPGPSQRADESTLNDTTSPIRSGHESTPFTSLHEKPETPLFSFADAEAWSKERYFGPYMLHPEDLKILEREYVSCFVHVNSVKNSER